MKTIALVAHACIMNKKIAEPFQTPRFLYYFGSKNQIKIIPNS